VKKNLKEFKELISEKYKKNSLLLFKKLLKSFQSKTQIKISPKYNLDEKFIFLNYKKKIQILRKII
jgi:hypothetical protein